MAQLTQEQQDPQDGFKATGTQRGADYLWNMIGSMCYSLSSFYYLMLVTRICGVMEGGVFALAFATAQLLLTLGRYGMRTYQATDTERTYAFGEYSRTRIFTCLGMVVLSLPYCLVMGYDLGRILIFFFVAGLKMLDAVEDVFHGELQRSDRVARMGQMLAARNVFSCIVFGVAIMATRKLLFTVVATDVLSLAFCLFINGWAVRTWCPRDKRFVQGHLRELFVICFPIFISTFLSLFLYNIPKYAIDLYLTEDYQTYYSILFMPSFVITLFSEIVTRPVLTSIAIAWNEDLAKFKAIIRRNFLLIAAATVGVVIGGHFVGRWLLELIYGVDLSPYKLDFVILLIGGGLSASVYVTYNILISIRAQRYIIMGYLATAAVAVPLTYWVVGKTGMFGASVAYLLTCLVLQIAFGLTLVAQIRLRSKQG